MVALPIQTVYSDVRFRSRLEARWAVFFDVLEIDWRYEHEGYDLNGRRYLCDFLLPQFNLWIEIKPVVPTEAEIAKCVALAAAGPGKVRLLYGAIGWWRWRGWTDPANGGGVGFWRERDREVWIGQADDTVALYCPCICPECGTFGVEYQGFASRLPCGHVTDQKLRTGDDKRIAVAVEVAKNFQFHYDDPPAGLPPEKRAA